MKLNTIPSIIAIALSLLIAYSFYSFSNIENKFLISGGSFLFMAATLLFAFGVNFELPRTSVVVKTVSIVFLILALASNTNCIYKIVLNYFINLQCLIPMLHENRTISILRYWTILNVQSV